MSITRTVAAISSLFFSSIVMAGISSDEFPVQINLNADGSGMAQGSMLHARESDNENERIGCFVDADDDGVSAWVRGVCIANDADGAQELCITYTSELIDVIHGMSDYGLIRFEWNAAGDCTHIRYSKTSGWLPNLKEDKK